MGVVRLSKSKILSGLQCPLRLWLDVHQPGLAVFDQSMQRAFASGHEVGDMARTLYPGGVLVGSQHNLSEAVRLTRRLLGGRADVVLYEPAFRARDVLVRLDVLRRRDGRCHLVEVKSATSVRPHHVTDAAVQAWIAAASGVLVHSVSVAHIDTSFVYPGGGRYDGLLREVDVTRRARALAARLPALVDGLRRMAGGAAPFVAPGARCADPYRCPFTGLCQDQSLVHAGVRRAGGAAKSDRRGASGMAAGAAAAAVATPGAGPATVSAASPAPVAGLPYPRASLALASVNPAVPLWPGTRPYERIPVAWSCDLQRRPTSAVEHRQFLAEPGGPSAREFVTSLVAALGRQPATVVVRDEAAAALLRAVAPRLPRHTGRLSALAERLVEARVLVRGSAAPQGDALSSAGSGVTPTAEHSFLYDVGGLAAGDAFLELAGRHLGAGDGVTGPRSPSGGISPGQASFADLPEVEASRRDVLHASLVAAIAAESRALFEFMQAAAQQP
jgi:hypothetical protein